MIGDSSFMRPIHRAKPGRPPSAGDLEKVQRAVFGARGRNGVRVYIDLDGMVIEGTGTAAKTAWSITATDQAQQQVTISAGWVIHGVTVADVQTAAVTVVSGTLAAPAYAVLEYVYASRTAQIVTTATVGYPVPDATTFRCALHSFYLRAGKIVHIKAHQNSDILIPGWA